MHLPSWLTQGFWSLLKQDAQDIIPSRSYLPLGEGGEGGEEEGTSQTQTVRAEPDSFIRLLKGRAGQAGGEGRTPLWPGWNKL